MTIRKGSAVWQGNLKDGKGNVKVESGVLDEAYSFKSRFEEGSGTNPEELIGAAHAGCFSMALSHELAEAGFEPKDVNTTANVHLENIDGDFKITKILLETSAEVPGIEKDKFLEIAEGAKVGCPVSQALSSVEIELKANLL